MAAYYKNVGNTVRVFDTEPAVKTKPVVKVKKRRSIVFVYNNDHKHKLSVLTVVTVMLIFTGAAGTAAAFASVSVTNQQMMTLGGELRDKLSQNNDLKQEVNLYDDPAAMRKLAQDKLGMAEPKPYQILHINVPEDNYAEYNQPGK